MKLSALLRPALVLTAISIFASTAKAQEVVPREDLEKVVPRVLKQVADLDNLPIKTNAVAAKAFGMKVKNYTAVIVADEGLTKEALENVGKEVMPLGQLWLNQLAPAVGTTTTPNDKLRLVTVTIKEEDHRLPLLLLGVRKSGEDSLELLVYAKAQEPLLTLPLKTFNDAQELPLTIEMHQGNATLGEIEIKVLGHYRATLPVGELSGL